MSDQKLFNIIRRNADKNYKITLHTYQNVKNYKIALPSVN